MSRTDKDLPYWYSEWYEPRHMCRKLHTKCDLSESPAHEKPTPLRYVQCSWIPLRSYKKWYEQCAPRWYRHHVWWNPQRVKERDHLGRMCKEYNANGDVEDTFQNYHHRNNAKWLFW